MSPEASRHPIGKPIVLVVLALFLLPVIARAALYAVADAPRSWREADWSSAGVLPPASEFPQARVIVYYARTGGWKGVLSLHSWIVLKRANTATWTRYDVVGWGNPVRINGWVPDGRWFGDIPCAIADIRGADAEALMPKIENAVRGYRYRHAGDYRIWPGPNSNTFTAAILREVPELGVALPSNAVGRDFRDGFYLGLTDSRGGLEINFWGFASLKLGWVEGFEVNLFGLVAGLDLRRPGVKLPAFGHVGIDGLIPAALARR